MEYTIKKDEKYLLLSLNEEKLDAVISPELKADLIKYNQEGHKNIILNLEKVKYVDSSGLSAILVGNRICNDEGGKFVLSNLNPHVEKLITISQLQSVLNIQTTVEEAIEFVFLQELENDIKKDGND